MSEKAKKLLTKGIDTGMFYVTILDAREAETGPIIQVPIEVLRQMIMTMMVDFGAAAEELYPGFMNEAEKGAEKRIQKRIDGVMEILADKMDPETAAQLEAIYKTKH